MTFRTIPAACLAGFALAATLLWAPGAASGASSNENGQAPTDAVKPQAPPGGSPVSELPGPGVRRMARRLEEVIRKIDPTKVQFMSTERAALIAHALEDPALPPLEKLNLTYRLGEELMRQGESKKAIETVRPLLALGEETLRRLPPGFVDQAHFVLALSELRLGEQENCLASHSGDSCLLPIRGSGIHTRQEGSRAAIREFTEMLRKNPGDMNSKWLMNIAYMTVGDYPDKVPPQDLIPPKVFDSEYPLPRFPNVADRLGLAVRSHAGGSIVEDFDRDGDLDIMVSSMGLHDQLRFFRNNGDGTFTDQTEAAGLVGEMGGLNLADADYNNDGYVDVFVLRGAWYRTEGRMPNSLLRNNGDGTFEDVTEEAGMLSFHPTQNGAWADYDNDGWLDLFVGNESFPGDQNLSELWHNNKDGTFTDRAADLGLPDFGFVKGAAWGDFNNDGRQDLYVSVLNGPNHLFRNDGPGLAGGPGGTSWTFTDVTLQAGTPGSGHSFPTWFWDYDNDGWLDIFAASLHVKSLGDVANLYLGLPSEADVPRLYRNRGDGTFEDVSHATGVDRTASTMAGNFGDLDNDGWLDFYLGTGDPQLQAILPNRMFRNDAGKRFQDVTTAGGFGHLQKAHGIAFGDIDNDGDQDVFEEMGGAFPGDVSYNVLYENPGNGNHWITLRLEGRRSNRSAIGARVRVRVKTASGERDIYHVVSTGGSFGCSSLQLEVGLGEARSVAEIEVKWPTTGVVQVFRDVAADQTYHIVEDQPKLEPVKVKSFKLAG